MSAKRHRMTTKQNLICSILHTVPGKSNQNKAWYSQPLGWRATQCCSAYALWFVLFSFWVLSCFQVIPFSYSRRIRAVEICCVYKDCSFAFRTLESKMPDNVFKKVDNVDFAVRTIYRSELHILCLLKRQIEFSDCFRRFWHLKLRLYTNKHQ